MGRAEKEGGRPNSYNSKKKDTDQSDTFFVTSISTCSI